MRFEGEKHVYVNIDVSVEDIYNEMSTSEENEMRNLLGSPFRIRTLEDEMKLELLEELFKKKSLNELQEIVNDK